MSTVASEWLVKYTVDSANDAVAGVPNLASPLQAPETRHGAVISGRGVDAGVDGVDGAPCLGSQCESAMPLGTHLGLYFSFHILLFCVSPSISSLLDFLICSGVCETWLLVTVAEEVAAPGCRGPLGEPVNRPWQPSFDTPAKPGRET